MRMQKYVCMWYVSPFSRLERESGYRCLAVANRMAVAMQLVYLFVVGILVSTGNLMVEHSM